MSEITLFSRSEILSYVCDIQFRRLFNATRFSQIIRNGNRGVVTCKCHM